MRSPGRIIPHGNYLVDIGANLKHYRKAKGFTQKDVWEATGLSKSTYTAYEARQGAPSAENVLALAKALGISTDELLLGPSEISVSQDLLPLMRRFSNLPPELLPEAKLALKCLLVGFENEALFRARER